MSQTAQNINQSVSALWQSVIGNGALIKDKLIALNDAVVRQQAAIKDKYTNPVFERFYVNGDSIKETVKDNEFYKILKDSNLDIAALRRSFEAVDSSEQATVNAFIAEVNKTLDELLKNSTNDYPNNVKDSTKQTIQTVADFIYSLTEEDQPDIKDKVDVFIHAIADWMGVVGQLEADQKAYVVSLLQRSDAVISILSPYQRTAEEPPLPKQSSYERRAQFRENLPKAEAEMKKGKLPRQKEVKDLHLADFFDAGMSFIDIKSYESVQVITQQVREAVSGFFGILYKIYEKNAAITPYLKFLEQQILYWLTLPADFRPENWVEVIHYIVNHIHYTLERITDPSFTKVNALVLPVLEKLDALFSQVNNEDFKLLVTPKESLGIWNIDLPDILDDEEEEDEYEQLPKAVQRAKPTGQEQVLAREQNETYAANDEPYQEPLTYNSVIAFLCFDEEFGALANLDKEYTDVIYNLYYNNWLGSRKYVIESDMYDFVKKNSLEQVLEDIKAKILAESGINIGEFIQYLIDKVVTLVNGLIDFIKDTVQYIIDELFKLVKTIIAFFQNVDLPPNARTLLKKMPPFANMPDGVTLLHIVAAIPYTLYEAFTNFEPELQTS